MRIGFGFLLFTTGALALAQQPARQHVAEKPLVLNLASQPLEDALHEFSRATGLKVMLYTDLGRGIISPRVSGTLTPGAALGLLLKGAALRFEYLDAQTVAVLPLDDQKTDSTTRPMSHYGNDGTRTASATVSAGVSDGARSRSHDSDEELEPDRETSNRQAKDRQRELDEIIVTGTRIRGAAPVGAPIHTLDRVEIENSGYTTTAQLIQSLPENFRGGTAGASADSLLSATTTGTNYAFGSGVNFRGLGSTATLVLVNGHRVASSGSGYFTDISTIPVSAIDHIDVLTDGASAVYGSDAIAGVINIILKDQSEGVDTGVRYGTANGLSTYGTNVELGRKWDGGGVTFGSDFSRQTELDVTERSYTSGVTAPTSIFPSYKQAALTAAAHQQFSDALEIHADAQYTGKSLVAYSSGTGNSNRQQPDLDRWSASIGVRYVIAATWALRYDASGGSEVAKTTWDALSGGLPTTLEEQDRYLSKFWDQSVGLAGDLFPLPGGPAKLAIGSSYRKEGYTATNDIVTPAPRTVHNDVSRNVASAYGELLIPVFGESNALPGLSKLTLSAAGRYDHYSDFGNTVNPKFGVSWFPCTDLEIRGAYSRSFRAPAAGLELVNSETGTTGILALTRSSPNGATKVPMVELFGARPGLQPEHATNTTVGLDFRPSFIPGLSLSLNYYDINYTNQLALAGYTPNPLGNPAYAPVVTAYATSAPVQALVAAARANGAFYFDATGGAFGPDPLLSTLYTYDNRIQNLSKTHTTGFDFSVNYPIAFGYEHLELQANITDITKFTTSLTASSPPISKIDYVSFPARIRLRGQINWRHSDFGVSAAANYVRGYTDNSAPIQNDVGAFTTVDLVASYTFPNASTSGVRGLVASISASNIFNKAPPYVFSGTPNVVGSHYDPANADPTGRLITFALTKHW